MAPGLVPMLQHCASIALHKCMLSFHLHTLSILWQALSILWQATAAMVRLAFSAAPSREVTTVSTAACRFFLCLCQGFVSVYMPDAYVSSFVLAKEAWSSIEMFCGS